MSIGKIFTAEDVKNVSFMKLSIFALFVGSFIVFGGASNTFAQKKGNQYEEPWFPAARFAAQAGGRKEQAIITLVKVEKADFETAEKGLTFQICMAVNVKKGSKKAVKQYAQTTVFRNDAKNVYVLRRWVLTKTPPPNCK
jgi:hypothetical protein